MTRGCSKTSATKVAKKSITNRYKSLVKHFARLATAKILFWTAATSTEPSVGAAAAAAVLLSVFVVGESDMVDMNLSSNKPNTGRLERLVNRKKVFILSKLGTSKKVM